MKPKSTRISGLATAFTACFCLTATAQITFNTANDGGNWGTASNWTPAAVPDAIDAEAIVNGAGPSGTAPATLALDVLLDGNYTIGKLTRTVADGRPATFPTGPTANDSTKGLTLATSTGIPTVSVVGDVFYYSSIFGSQGFEKTGAGRFTFRFNAIEQNYTGTVKISAGTLGIQTDRNLGDINNAIEIADGARLYAEPGSNSGTITLPASRSITLLGAGQFGSLNTSVNLLIESPISDGGNEFGPVKTDAGLVTLAGTNSWTGSTVINAGILSATRPEALPGYASQTYSVNGSSTLAIRFGDASTWTSAAIEALLGNASFASGAFFGLDTTGNTEAAVLEGDLSVSNLSKVGPGTLVIADPQSSIANLSLNGGTLELGESGSLPNLTAATFSNGSALNIGNTSPSLNTLSLSQTEINMIAGSGGTLTLEGTGDYTVNRTATGVSLDMSDLSNFTFNRSANGFQLNSNGANVINTVNLAKAGTNTINGTNVRFGGGGSNAAGQNVLVGLGQTNVINAGAEFLVAFFQGNGNVSFQSGLTDPTLKVRGADGSEPVPRFRVGQCNSGNQPSTGILNLSGGSLDASAIDFDIAVHFAGANTAATGTLTMPAGSITATTLSIAHKALNPAGAVSTGIPTITGTLNQSGGTVDATTVYLGKNVNTALPNLIANYNLSGGELIATTISGNGATFGANTTRSLTLNGGTLRNKAGADLTISGVDSTAQGLLKIGVGTEGGSFVAETGRSIILGSNVSYSPRINSAVVPVAGALQVTGNLSLSGSPALSVLDDAETAATLPAGTKLVLIDYTSGSLTGTFDGLADGDTVSVTKGEVTNNFVIDYDDPAYGGKAVTLTVPSTGDNYASWASINGVTGGPGGDHDSDGVSNLVEYALADGGERGVLSGNTITFNKRGAPHGADLSYAIEVSTDLGLSDPWLVTATGVTDTAASITYTFTPGTPVKNFARLKLVQVP